MRPRELGALTDRVVAADDLLAFCGCCPHRGQPATARLRRPVALSRRRTSTRGLMTTAPSRTTCRRVAIVLAPLMLALGVLLPSTAHAEWYFTKSGAQSMAKDYVSGHYSET